MFNFLRWLEINTKHWKYVGPFSKQEFNCTEHSPLIVFPGQRHSSHVDRRESTNLQLLGGCLKAIISLRVIAFYKKVNKSHKIWNTLAYLSSADSLSTFCLCL
jgi:hypothetical protein